MGDILGARQKENTDTDGCNSTVYMLTVTICQCLRYFVARKICSHIIHQRDQHKLKKELSKSDISKLEAWQWTDESHSAKGIFKQSSIEVTDSWGTQKRHKLKKLEWHTVECIPLPRPLDTSENSSLGEVKMVKIEAAEAEISWILRFSMWIVWKTLDATFYIMHTFHFSSPVPR